MFDGVEPLFTRAMAEELALAHMRRLGLPDAGRVVVANDHGVDLAAHGAVACLRTDAEQATAVDVHGLRGAINDGGQAMFYSRAGYTSEAVEVADEIGVALFCFDTMNRVAAANDGARHLVALAHPTSPIETALVRLRSIKLTEYLVGEVLDGASSRPGVPKDVDWGAVGAVATAVTRWTSEVEAFFDAMAKANEVQELVEGIRDLPPGTAARRQAEAVVHVRVAEYRGTVEQIRAEQVELVAPLIVLLGLDPEEVGITAAELKNMGTEPMP